MQGQQEREAGAGRLLADALLLSAAGERVVC
jgi:hypothetical protein